MSETGSTTGWGVGSSVHSSPTIQSHQTADFQAESKQAVSAGIFAGIVRLFPSPVKLPVSQVEFSLPSPHPKIPFPAVGFRPPRPMGNSGILGFLGLKRTFRARSVLIAGSTRGLRTVGSILPEHHEVALLQCRGADDLRPQRARDPVQGTRVRSSC
jgi:hypothetical protein